MTDIVNKVAGRAKRLAGELAGRPDKVLEGEAQEAERPEEGAAARTSGNKRPPPSTGREK